MLDLVSGTIKLYYNCRTSSTNSNTINSTSVNSGDCNIVDKRENTNVNTEMGMDFDSYLKCKEDEQYSEKKSRKNKSSAEIKNQKPDVCSTGENNEKSKILRNKNYHNKQKLLKILSDNNQLLIFNVLLCNLVFSTIFIYICFLSNLNFNYLNFSIIKFEMINRSEKNKPVSQFISNKIDDLMRLMIFFITEYNESYQKAKQIEFLKYLSDSPYDGKISKLLAETGRSYFNNIQNSNNANISFSSNNTFKEYESFKQIYKYSSFKIGFTGYCKLNKSTGNTCISNIENGLDLFSTIFRDLGNSLFQFMETTANMENFNKYLDVGSSFALLYEFIIDNAGKYVPAYKNITKKLSYISQINRLIPLILLYMLILNIIVIINGLIFLAFHVKKKKALNSSKKAKLDLGTKRVYSCSLLIKYLKFLNRGRNFQKIMIICFLINSLIVLGMIIYISTYVGHIKPIITEELRLININFGEGFYVFIGISGFNLLNLALSLK